MCPDQTELTSNSIIKMVSNDLSPAFSLIAFVHTLVFSTVVLFPLLHFTGFSAEIETFSKSIAVGNNNFACNVLHDFFPSKTFLALVGGHGKKLCDQYNLCLHELIFEWKNWVRLY